MIRYLFFFVTMGHFIYPLSSQNGWTKLTDSTNPITKLKTLGKYKGAAFVDINNDGLQDLFAIPNKVFINNGGLSFSEKKDTMLNPRPIQVPGGCSWADIDNDGDMDVVIAQNPCGLYINDGKGNFTNASNRLENIADFAAWGVAIADINNDKRLDIVFAHAVGFHGQARRQPSRIYIQSPDLTFKLRKGYFITDSLRPYTVPYFHDYDLDADMDLFVASGPGGSPGFDFHYINKINDAATAADTMILMKDEIWAKERQDGQSYNFIDYDNDGDLDLCITNYGGGGQAPSRFYENLGGGSYISKTFGFTTVLPRLSNGWGDFDNDGDLDVITTSDFGATRYYQNNGDKSFTAITTGLTTPAGSAGMTSGDIDNDGDLDVFVYGDTNVISLFVNTSLATGNHFVSYVLKGTASNQSAIGATVRLKATINGKPTWQLRQVNVQNTFQGQNDIRVHFGLKDATIIDSVIILWPSGLREVYVKKSIDKISELLVEGAGTILTSQHDIKINNLPFKLFPNPTNGTIHVSGNISDSRLQLFDISGSLVLEEKIGKSERHTVDTSNLSKGTYLVMLRKEKSIGLQKLIRF